MKAARFRRQEELRRQVNAIQKADQAAKAGLFHVFKEGSKSVS